MKIHGELRQIIFLDVLYEITADPSPASGGSIIGTGGYKYGQIPDLIAVCATNYSFIGWSPALTPVTGNKHYTALFEYNSPDIHVTSINMTSNLGLDEGENSTLNPVIEPSNATNKSIIWNSSDPNVATVDSYGIVTAHSNGTATISAHLPRRGLHSYLSGYSI